MHDHYLMLHGLHCEIGKQKETLSNPLQTQPQSINNDSEGTANDKKPNVAKFLDAKRMSSIKHFQEADIRTDRYGKKEPSATNLRLLESKAKAVASIDVCQ